LSKVPERILSVQRLQISAQGTRIEWKWPKRAFANRTKNIKTGSNLSRRYIFVAGHYIGSAGTRKTGGAGPFVAGTFVDLRPSVVQAAQRRLEEALRWLSQ